MICLISKYIHLNTYFYLHMLRLFKKKMERCVTIPIYNKYFKTHSLFSCFILLLNINIWFKVIMINAFVESLLSSFWMNIIWTETGLSIFRVKCDMFTLTTMGHVLDPKAENDAEMKILSNGKYCKIIVYFAFFI